MARKSRKTPEINAGSMADIAFLLLIFFIIATTMDVDRGILRRLPPPLPPDVEKPPPIKERNVFQVLINANNQLMVEGELLDIRNLKNKTKEFIANPADNEDLPEKKPPQNIDLIGIYKVSKGVISLQNDRGTAYGMYLQVQNELTTAYRELRDDFSMQKFGKKYSELDKNHSKAIQEAIPMVISEAEPKNIAGMGKP
ncbi:MAG: biopolymer transporter ExbD [Bacteroidetes bacterium]|nr:biopolymer transporter ExbD [Bacteroidota bacterium]